MLTVQRFVNTYNSVKRAPVCLNRLLHYIIPPLLNNAVIDRFQTITEICEATRFNVTFSAAAVTHTIGGRWTTADTGQ